MLGEPPPGTLHFSPMPLVLFVISLLDPATPRSSHSTTSAAPRTVAHAHTATCAITAVADFADFLAAALAGDPPTLMVARARYRWGSVRR